MSGYIIYPSETAVTDEKGSRAVSCPTEDEAVEYIREQKGSESDESEKRRHLDG